MSKSYWQKEYYTKYGSDGVKRLYVREVEVTLLKTRQGKKADIQDAIKTIYLLRRGVDEVLLDRYTDD